MWLHGEPRAYATAARDAGRAWRKPTESEEEAVNMGKLRDEFEREYRMQMAYEQERGEAFAASLMRAATSREVQRMAEEVSMRAD